MDCTDASTCFGGVGEIRELLICLSVSNLRFMRRWYDIEVLEAGGMDYFRTGPPGNTQFWATLIAIGITTAAFWAIASLIRRLPTGRKARCGAPAISLRGRSVV